MGGIGIPTQCFPGCCNLNWYRSGRDSLGFHRDDERRWGLRGAPKLIVSFTVGLALTIEVDRCRLDVRDPRNAATHAIELGHGAF